MGFPARRNLDRRPRQGSVSIPSRGLWVFPPRVLILGGRFAGKFQSLVGVYGFSRFIRSFEATKDSPVSIPSRGLWVFPLG